MSAFTNRTIQESTRTKNGVFNMRKKLIGRKHFEGLIDITDPCYDKDVWCRMTATVKAGTYECRVWRDTEKHQFGDEEYTYKTVGIIGIYLDGYIPQQKKMENIGSIGVDAGMAGFFMDKPDYTDEQWAELCQLVEKGDAWIIDEGFFSTSGWGDGYYDVYAYKQNNEIIALEIRFM